MQPSEVPSWMYNVLYLKKSYYKQANVQKPLPLKFFIFYVFTYVVMKVVGYNYQSSIHRSVMPASLFPKVTCKSVFWWLAQILLFMISTSQNVLPGTNREAANLIFIPTIRTGSRIILCSISFLSPSLCTWCKFHIQHWIDVRTGNVDYVLMEPTSYAINENMTHVLRICSWIPVTFGVSVVVVFSNYVFQ